jgi:hypothetical protein
MFELFSVFGMMAYTLGAAWKGGLQARMPAPPLAWRNVSLDGGKCL